MNEVNKNIKGIHQVLDKIVNRAHVKANITDAGGNFYVYDLYDQTGTLIALNRYVYKNSDKQPFDPLAEDEELILNPPFVKPDPMEMISSGK